MCPSIAGNMGGILYSLYDQEPPTHLNFHSRSWLTRRSPLHMINNRDNLKHTQNENAELIACQGTHISKWQVDRQGKHKASDTDGPLCKGGGLHRAVACCDICGTSSVRCRQYSLDPEMIPTCCAHICQKRQCTYMYLYYVTNMMDTRVLSL